MGMAVHLRFLFTPTVVTVFPHAIDHFSDDHTQHLLLLILVQGWYSLSSKLATTGDVYKKENNDMR